ncbi:hypothetical protein N9C66_00450 [Akkermansiaceae bacterium]|nr:hypothetical protein [Akkermansiaceae bacterium]MDA7930116.1 hypothetical protein [Akkermansiaceae bacterium]MDA7933780.1 hypothetical protein [Akkermansiaceae bacterium]MDA9829783.1 hypothetical protein [Akkermansiaceae bacterium]MDB4464743.1 hypothetical protein [Akkermansiaceae bacterium]
MEIRHQTCLSCHSQELENIIVRDAGRTQSIFVRCAKCHEFVARYILKEYYHHGRTLDSLLQSTGQSVESGREMLHQFKEREGTAKAQFEKMIQNLQDSQQS